MAFTPLNALNQFLAVARRRSFAAAASELGISSSALSQSVRQLEERLGVTLLSRTTRSVALTESGRRLLEQAGPALAQALEALKATAAQKGQVMMSPAFRAFVDTAREVMTASRSGRPGAPSR